MKLNKLFSWLFGLMGICAAAAGVYLALHFLNTDPVLLTPPDAAREQAARLLDAVCAGEYDDVSAALYGTPGLGIDRQPDSQVGVLIWDAYEESLSYELRGGCYATDSGVAQDAVITGLDLDSVTGSLGDRSKALLEQRVAQAEDISEIYDENNEYREEVVMAVLLEAAEQAIAEDSQVISREVTLNLIYENGQWWIMPDSALLEAISAGIVN